MSVFLFFFNSRSGIWWLVSLQRLYQSDFPRLAYRLSNQPTLCFSRCHWAHIQNPELLVTLFCLTACSPWFIPLCTLVSALKDFNQHDITSVRNKRGGKKTVHFSLKSSAHQSRISLTGSNAPSEAHIIKMSTSKCEHEHNVFQNAALSPAQNSQDPEELLP